MNKFTYLGVEHEQTTDKKSIYTHQNGYTMELHMIPLPAHSVHRPRDDLSIELHTLATSLLGALSW
eukprot:1885708-Pyramimonas_sp.AAC.1